MKWSLGGHARTVQSSQLDSPSRSFPAASVSVALADEENLSPRHRTVMFVTRIVSQSQSATASALVPGSSIIFTWGRYSNVIPPSSASRT